MEHQEIPMKTTVIQRSAPALLLALLGSVAMAQGYGGTDTSRTTGTDRSAPAAGSRLAHADSSFLEDAAQINLAEIRASGVALEKSSNADVKAYAQMMVDEHKKATEELRALADSKGVKLPDDASLMAKGKTKVLEQREGASFDKHYIESIGVKAHEDAIKRFEKASKEAKDPDVKAFADKMLPNLRTHLEKAKSVASMVGVARK